MTVNIPQKAGFVATTKEWDGLVRIAENLAAQVVQRDAALREMQAERDAAQSSAGFWGRSCAKIMAECDAARDEVARLTELASFERDTAAMHIEKLNAEVARLTAALKEYGWHLDRCPAADCSTTKCECGYAVLRQPAQSACRECGGSGRVWYAGTDHEQLCGACFDEPAPAQE